MLDKARSFYKARSATEKGALIAGPFTLIAACVITAPRCFPRDGAKNDQAQQQAVTQNSAQILTASPYIDLDPTFTQSQNVTVELADTDVLERVITESSGRLENKIGTLSEELQSACVAHISEVRLEIFALTQVVSGSQQSTARATALLQEAHDLHTQKRFHLAIGKYHAALEHSDDWRARVGLGLAYHQVNDPEAAAAEYRRAAASNPENAACQFRVGALLVQHRRPEDAVPYLVTAMQLDPADSSAHAYLAEAFVQQGKGKEALTEAQTAVRLAPLSGLAYLAVGDALLALGKPDAAVEYLRIAASMAPPLTNAQNNLGVALWRSGDTQSGIEAWRTALERAPDAIDPIANLGTALSAAGEVVEARELLGRAVKLDPSRAAVHHYLGLTRWKLGNKDGALVSLRHSLELAPEVPVNHTDLGGVLLECGMGEAALAVYRDAVSRWPDLAEAHNGLGAASLRQGGDLAEVEQHFTTAIKLAPNEAMYYDNLRQVLSRMGKHEQAIATARQAVALGPGKLGYIAGLGDALMSAERYSGAQEQWCRVLELDPKNVLAYARLALCALSQGDHEVAVKYASEPVKGSFAAGLSYLVYGAVMHDVERAAEALPAIKDAVAANPSDLLTRVGLVAALKGTGDLTEAYAECKSAIALAPSNSLPHYLLAGFLFDQHRFADSLIALERASELGDDSAGLHNNLGATLSRLGQRDAAEAEFRYAIERNPSLAIARYNLGRNLFARDRVEEAVTAYRVAIALDPRHGEGAFELGNALLRRKRLEEAAEAFHNAIDEDPRSSKFRCNLGIALDRMGHLSEALSEYERAVTLNARDGRASYFLATALARSGSTSEALDRVAAAVSADRRFRDWAFGDPAFEKLRESPEFRAALHPE